MSILRRCTKTYHHVISLSVNSADGFSFFTGSGRILERTYSRGGLIKKSPSKGGGLIELHIFAE